MVTGGAIARRSRRELVENSWYPTIDPRPVQVLLDQLSPGMRFVEPCAGDGALIRHLETAGHRCIHASDIAPRARWIEQRCAMRLPPRGLVITNPPYTPRSLMHELIDHWLDCGAECWLLIDMDWASNISAGAYLIHCDRILPAGRMEIYASTGSGDRNFGWFHFPGRRHAGPPLFIPRGVTP